MVVDEGRVLTCVCMLGYWMWDAVPIWFLYALVLDAGCCCRFIFWGIRPAALLVMDCFEVRFLYASVLDAEHCADLVPVFFGVGRGTLCRFIFIYCVFWALGRMYIRFYCLLSAVEFSAGDVAAVWAAAEEV